VLLLYKRLQALRKSSRLRKNLDQTAIHHYIISLTGIGALMKYIMKLAFIALVSAAIWGTLNHSKAEPNASASHYIQALGNQALSVIVSQSLNKAQKQKKLDTIFSENIDFPWVGRFVMGRTWREATDAQKTRYVAEYKKFLIMHYTSRFTNFTSGTFKVINEKDDGDGEYTVAMQLTSDEPGSQAIEVDYRVRKSENGASFKIFDVIVEGVSLLSTQRSEFSSVIASKGLDHLIDQLAAKSSKAPL
jgi:phospholipid transport system substrate-binding protein